MIKKERKSKIITANASHKTDTGSPEVQIALFTNEIERLSNHLKKHKKDDHSRKGLIKMVANRRAHMKYLERKTKNS